MTRTKRNDRVEFCPISNQGLYSDISLRGDDEGIMRV